MNFLSGAYAIVGVSEARIRLRHILAEVLPDHDVVLLRRDKPVAVLMNPDRLAALYVRIEGLEDQLSVLAARVETAP